MLGDIRLQTGRDRLPLDNRLIRHFEDGCEDVANPGVVDGRVRPQAPLIVSPFFVDRAKLCGDLCADCIQSLGKGIHQDRHAQERAGYLEK